ncbi:MAG: cytochrome P450 [Gemmatimonadaceae bacterium]|nr:cytochrome P450 [Gemmatimonadaceae bacterium]
MSAAPASVSGLVRLRPRYPLEFTRHIAARDGWHRVQFFQRMQATHGDLVMIPIAGMNVVLVSHPDDIRDVLVTQGRSMHKGRALERAKMLIGDGLLTSEGEFHLRQRRLVQPAFHRERIAAYAGTMSDATMAVARRWRDGASVDVHAEMMALTLAIVSGTLFSADVSRDSSDVADALDAAFQAVSFGFGFGPFSALLDRLPLPSRRRFRRAKDTLDAIIARVIAEHRAGGVDRGDLLSMLIAAQDDEGDGTGMSDTQLRDEAITLFIAGHETTANALTFAWLALDRHPAVAAALRAEVDAVLGDRMPTLDDVGRLPYTRAVMAETMRLYPPAYIVGRKAVAPVTLRGETFAPGTIFVQSQWLVHRDPRWWPEPTLFRPERWLGDDSASRPKLAYFPFGAGTRICVGEQFAWMEAVICLAVLARRWEVRVPGPDPALEPIITLRPKGGLPGRLVQR